MSDPSTDLLVQMAALALKGKVVLITGGTGGIGKAMARMFSCSGATTVVTSTKQEKADALVKDLPGVKAYVLDIQEQEQVEQTVLKIKEEVGLIDILINNAGFALAATQPFWEQDINSTKEVLKVSVNGLIYITHSVLKHHMMKRDDQPRGTIVNISSITGHQAPPQASFETSYHTAKAAVEGFSNVLRNDTLGTNIRVLVHRPGTCRTEFHERRKGYDKEATAATYGGQRPLDPEDIAVGVLWQTIQPERISVILMETLPSAQRSLYQCDHDYAKRNGLE